MNLATAVAASIDERALITRLAGTVVGGDPRALAGRPVISFTVAEEFFMNGENECVKYPDTVYMVRSGRCLGGEIFWLSLARAFTRRGIPAPSRPSRGRRDRGARCGERHEAQVVGEEAP
jgi:hypothetical protein